MDAGDEQVPPAHDEQQQQQQLQQQQQRNAHVDNAIRAIRQKKPLPEIDFTIHTMEDGTQVNTTERVCKGTYLLSPSLPLPARARWCGRAPTGEDDDDLTICLQMSRPPPPSSPPTSSSSRMSPTRSPTSPS